MSRDFRSQKPGHAHLWAQALGASVGYLAAGPLGALLGYWVGKKAVPPASLAQSQIVFVALLGVISRLLRQQGLAPGSSPYTYTMRFLGRLLELDAEDQAQVDILMQRLLGLRLDLETMLATIRTNTPACHRQNLLDIVAAVSLLATGPDHWRAEFLQYLATRLELAPAASKELHRRWLRPAPVLEPPWAYALFGLQPGAPLAEVKAAYRQMCKSYHPDSRASQEARERTAAIMAVINNAYRVVAAASSK